MSLLICAIVLLFSSSNLASYCGQAAIPYSFEALANGQPVLGCARPTCFGWNAHGRRSADSAQFYRIGKVADGFLRGSDVKGPIVQNASNFQPQYSICDQSYISDHCSGTSWVGGLAPTATIDFKHPFKLMCCSYNKLSQSSDEGRVEIRPGQVVKGGEVKNANARQTSFEYIANVQRLFDRNGVVYVLTMKKFPCVPEPIAQISGIESDTTNFLIDNINAMSETKESEAAKISAKRMFNNRKFDLLQDMPQEQSVAQLNGSVPSVAQSLNMLNKSFTRTRLGIPQAKPMTEDAITFEADGAISAAKLVNPLDAKATEYQKEISSSQRLANISSGQSGGSKILNQADPSIQPLKKSEQYRNYEYNQQPKQSSQQYPYSRAQHQALYNGQQQTETPLQTMQSMLDPLGMLRGLGLQPFNNQQYASSAYSAPTQVAQQFPTVATLFPSFTLVTAAPFSSVGLAASAATTYKSENPGNDAATGTKPGQQYEVIGVVDSAPITAFSLPKIPTPEEIENVLPPASKRLIATVTKTLLGYNRFV